MALAFCKGLDCLEEKLRKKFAEEYQISDIEFKISLTNNEKEIYRIDNLKMFENNPNRFSVKLIFLDGSVEKVSGFFYNLIEVAVLNKRISKGEQISSGDIDYKKIKEDRYFRKLYTEKEDLIGKIAQKNLRPFTPIKKSELKGIIAVEKKSLVAVVYQNKKMKLRLSAIALESGRIGDNIKLRNNSSGKEIFGRVIGKNLVTVNSINNAF